MIGDLKAENEILKESNEKLVNRYVVHVYCNESKAL